MTELVSLVKHTEDSLQATIAKALALIDFKANGDLQNVVIKPNLCYYWNSTTGYTTDPKVVSGIIDYIRHRFGADIDIAVAEADATAMKTRHAFPILGYEKMVKEKNVRLLNLSEDQLVDHKVYVNNQELTYRVPQTLLKADLFINAPKLKIITAVHVTCAMKNLFGAIGTPRKFSYHSFLEEAIVGINKILRPHLTIVDGIVALGRHPVKMNLLMAGIHAFSVDWVASQIMGYNPRRVKYLKMACEEKLGDPRIVKTVGEDLTAMKDLFPHVNTYYLKFTNSLQIRLLGLYSKIVGDVIPPFLDKS